MLLSPQSENFSSIKSISYETNLNFKLNGDILEITYDNKKMGARLLNFAFNRLAAPVFSYDKGFVQDSSVMRIQKCTDQTKENSMGWYFSSNNVLVIKFENENFRKNFFQGLMLGETETNSLTDEQLKKQPIAMAYTASWQKNNVYFETVDKNANRKDNITKNTLKKGAVSFSIQYTDYQVVSRSSPLLEIKTPHIESLNISDDERKSSSEEVKEKTIYQPNLFLTNLIFTLEDNILKITYEKNLQKKLFDMDFNRIEMASFDEGSVQSSSVMSIRKCPDQTQEASSGWYFSAAGALVIKCRCPARRNSLFSALMLGELNKNQLTQDELAKNPIAMAYTEPSWQKNNIYFETRDEAHHKYITISKDNLAPGLSIGLSIRYDDTDTIISREKSVAPDSVIKNKFKNH